MLVRRPYEIVETQSLERLPTKDPAEPRCVTRVLVMWADRSAGVAIYNTHLDVWDNTDGARLAELEVIHQFMGRDLWPCVLVGDFNSVAREDYSKEVWAWMEAQDQQRIGQSTRTLAQNYVRQTMRLVSSFQLLKHPPPWPPSAWSERLIDFVYFDAKDAAVLRTWLTFSTASDHLPISVLVDADAYAERFQQVYGGVLLQNCEPCDPSSTPTTTTTTTTTTSTSATSLASLPEPPPPKTCPFPPEHTYATLEECQQRCPSVRPTLSPTDTAAKASSSQYIYSESESSRSFLLFIT